MKRDEKWVVPRVRTFDDPRIAIARHIGWTKTTSTETEYSLPEPDHFNYAGLSNKPIECPVIENQVFYQDKKTKLWWSVYFVTEQKNELFLSWGENIDFDLYWTPLKPTRMRQRRGLLKAKTKISDHNQTDNERLYTMGYYENLKVKYFNDDAEYVNSLLGPARAVLKNPIPEELDEVED
jgi:hypothetical protein